MKTIFKVFAIIWLGITLSIMINTEAKAQKKETVSEINTASPVFYFIYEGDEGDGAVELQIHDRKHQFVSMSFDRLSDKAKGDDPKNPLIKLINIPEVGPLAFRQVESLEEAKLQVDGLKVLAISYNRLREAARIIYQ